MAGEFIELPSNCPPGTAVEAYGEVFRVVPQDPPREEDFFSHKELGRQKPEEVSDCDWASISLFTSLDKCHRAKRRVAALHNISYVFAARGTLNSAKGVILKSRNGHVHWWPYKGVVRHEGFVVVERLAVEEASV